MSNKNKTATLHMIGHGHIDPTWLWDWREGYEEVRATFRSALDRMSEDPDVRFSASSACFYDWIHRCDPVMFDAIKKRVAEGRWELAGGMWIEPDCNIPCGEAFVRQGLYAQHFFKHHFNQCAKVGFNPDSFGHTGQLPQLLKKLGMNYYIYMRPMPVVEMDYPNGTTFNWQAPDGSQVLTTNLLEDYNADATLLEERIGRFTTHEHLNPGQTQVLAFFGVGNHGGGPTKSAMQVIRNAQEDDSKPNVEFATLHEYMQAFQKQDRNVPLATIAQDLQNHARGCYSAHAGVKQWMRQTEHALMTAERMASITWLDLNRAYPKDQLEEAWKNLLYNQFHDILAGTSLEITYTHTRDQMGAARHSADTIINEALQCLANEIDTTAMGNTAVLFNPLPWPVHQRVDLSPIVERALDTAADTEDPNVIPLKTFGPWKAYPNLHIVDSNENPVPLQKTRGDKVTGSKYTIMAQVPAMGYSCFHVRAGVQSIAHTQSLEVSTTHLETDWWRIELDPRQGHITRLLDKQNNLELLTQGNYLVVLNDSSDTWSHGIKGFRDEVGCFEKATARIVEQGDVLATIQVKSTYGKSSVIQEYTLYRDDPRIGIHLKVNWQEAYHMLKIGWDTTIEAGTTTYDTAYGHQVHEANGEECPGQQWFDLSGTIAGQPYGLSILNDSKYAFDTLKQSMRMTLLRSPAYAHHDPAIYTDDCDIAIMDQGWHTMNFQLLPHTTDWKEWAIPHRAWELNQPVIPLVESAHPGTRPAQDSMLSCDHDHVLVSVIKHAENDNGLILRAYETIGKDTEATIKGRLLSRPIPLSFTPHEIKTIAIHPEKNDYTLINLLEEPMESH